MCVKIKLEYVKLKPQLAAKDPVNKTPGSNPEDLNRYATNSAQIRRSGLDVGQFTGKNL